MEGYIDRSVLITGNFNTPLSVQDRSNRHRLSKEVDLSNRIDKVNLYSKSYT